MRTMVNDTAPLWQMLEFDLGATNTNLRNSIQYQLDNVVRVAGTYDHLPTRNQQLTDPWADAGPQELFDTTRVVHQVLRNRRNLLLHELRSVYDEFNDNLRQVILWSVERSTHSHLLLTRALDRALEVDATSEIATSFIGMAITPAYNAAMNESGKTLPPSIHYMCNFPLV
jgi:hypothetical protein